MRAPKNEVRRIALYLNELNAYQAELEEEQRQKQKDAEREANRIRR